MAKDICGVVLCGGKSSRMGEDKGLILLNGITWAEIAYQKLSKLKIPVFISINTEQVYDYNKIFEIDNLIIDNQNISGPLNGLLSANSKFSKLDLFVVACDLPNLSQKVIQSLFQAYLSSQNKNLNYVYKVANYCEPMCAIYSNESFEKIKNRLNSKSHNFGLKDLIEQSETIFLECNENWYYCFKNCNLQIDKP